MIDEVETNKLNRCCHGKKRSEHYFQYVECKHKKFLSINDSGICPFAEDKTMRQWMCGNFKLKNVKVPTFNINKPDKERTKK